jgi:heterodisulfide reductase subunit D
MDMAATAVQQSLVGRVNDLSGQTVQLCYHCHKCTAGCPAALSMEYGPDRILRMIQLGQWERLMSSRDAWLCLGCEMCGAHCPNEIDINEVMIALKEITTESGYRVDDCQSLREVLADYLIRRPGSVIDDRLCAGFQRLNQLQQTIGTARNVSGDDNSNRLIWSENMERQLAGIDGRQGAEIVYFVGCVASFFPGSYSVPQAIASILEASGADFTTLGGQEWCCGYPLLLMGQREAARGLIEHNVAQVKALGASRVVFACPSCYHMWKFVYPKVAGEDTSLDETAQSLANLDVLHASELVGELVANGNVTLGALDMRVTYHDPCDLGRKSHVFEPPRRLLKSIPGLSFVEMSSSGQISECCGGGGNLESFEPEVTDQVSEHRIERVLEVDAQVVASSCQQCERTLTRAVRRNREARRARIRVMDVAQLVWASINAAGSQQAS